MKSNVIFMKRLLSFLFSVAIVFSVVGCNYLAYSGDGSSLDNSVFGSEQGAENSSDKVIDKDKDSSGVSSGERDSSSSNHEQDKETDKNLILAEELLEKAVFFDKAEKWLTNDFTQNNKTHYPFTEDGLPNNRTYMVEGEEEFSEIFSSFPQEVDFDKEILLVYLFTDIYYGFDCSLQIIYQNEEKVKIQILHDMAEPSPDGIEPPSTSQPIQRCFVIKLPIFTQEKIQINIIYF